MKFIESGLPKNKLLEEAFNYSQANILSHRDEVMKDFARQILQAHEQQLAMLEMDKDAKLVSEEDYKHEKNALVKMRDEQMRMGPQVVDSELANSFKQRRVAGAQELCKHSENAPPELLAALVLVECVRSPIDYLNIAKKFGDNVANMVAEIQHIDAYPSEREKALAGADGNVKRAYLALLVTSLVAIQEQVKMMAKFSPDQKVVFHGGQEEMLFGNAKSLWGNDKKLDKRFLDIFNGTAAATMSPFRLEVDAAGNLELVKSNLTPPNDPKRKSSGPGSKTGLGDDVF